MESIKPSTNSVMFYIMRYLTILSDWFPFVSLFNFLEWYKMCVAMKEKLKHIEEQLQNLIEKKTLLLLGINDAENTLSQRLVNAMETAILEEEDGQISAPNIYNLYMSPKFAPDVRTNQGLLDKLAGHLTAAAENAGVQFTAKPTLNVFPDSSLQDGEFEIAAMWKKEDIVETQGMAVDKEQNEWGSIPPRAFMIIEGTQIFTLEQEVINIGRMRTNDLVIDDPRVSRNHAQLRAMKESYMLFDLDSSGGTFVNGVPISQTQLRPGDVISFAGVAIVYGQDEYESIAETQEYQTPQVTDEGSTNAVQLDDFDHDVYNE